MSSHIDDTDYSSTKKRLKNDHDNLNHLSQSVKLDENRKLKGNSVEADDDDENVTKFLDWCNYMGIFIDLNKVNSEQKYLKLLFVKS